MKKIMVMMALAAAAVTAQAEVVWSWWVPARDAWQNLRGCSLGVAAGQEKLSGAQVNLLWGKLGKLTSGCQASFGYSRADELRNGCQVATVCSSDKAALQFGLICVNKDGFLPVFPFFNFSKRAFGAGR